jgi:hypothetical protein
LIRLLNDPEIVSFITSSDLGFLCNSQTIPVDGTLKQAVLEISKIGVTGAVVVVKFHRVIVRPGTVVTFGPSDLFCEVK